MSGLDHRPSRAMREAIQRLAAGDAVAGESQYPGVQRFIAPGDVAIAVHTLKSLSRRGLARQLLRPSRFTLTQAGRALAASL